MSPRIPEMDEYSPPPIPKEEIKMSPELGKIFGELSWTSRLQLLDKYYPSPNKTVMSMEYLMEPTKVPRGMTPSLNVPPPNFNPAAYPEPTIQGPQVSSKWPPDGPMQGLNGPNGPVEPGYHGPPIPGPQGRLGPGWGHPWQGPPQAPRRPPWSRRADRRVGLSALRMPRRPVAGRRQTPSGVYPPTNPPPQRDDDTSMKLKLFRLMYETVRDSDLKVKRAELIKTQYVNSSAFEVGYLLGDISDKYNIMSDIAMTLRRLYGEWRPLEHINAYEQIANQAIEISHLIDLAKTVNKRTEGGSGNKMKQ